MARSRSLGDRLFKQSTPPLVPATPQIITRKLMPGDQFVLLASDGVWDVMTGATACNLVAQTLVTGTPQDAAAAVCETALRGRSDDNISAVVVPLGGYIGM